MRRWSLVVLPLLALGCGREEPVLSRVALPKGVERPKGLRPDAPPLTRPATLIEREPSPPVAAPEARASDGFAVEGACRYGEGTTECWNAQGAPDPTLTKVIAGALRINPSEPLPLAYGRKCRLAVVDSVPDRPGSTALFSSGGPTVPNASRPFESLPVAGGKMRTLVFLAEDAKATVGSVVCERRARLPQEVPIALKKGASASLAGCRFTVDSVAKLSPEDEEALFMHGKPSWRVVLRRTGVPKPEAEFFPVDPYPIYLNDGRRMADFRKGGNPTFAPATAPTVRSFSYSAMPEGAIGALVDRDPAKLRTLSIGGNAVTRVRLGGIPLDPR